MEPQPVTAAWRLALAGLIALAAAMGIGRFVYTPILPVMAEALALTSSQTGLIASANFAGYLVGALLAATPPFAGAERRWMLIGLGASALTTLAMGLAQVMTVFLVLRFVGGVASAFVLVFGSTVVLERLTAAGRGGLSAVYFAGVGVGVAASAVLVWALVAQGHDWRALWLVCGVVSLAAGVLVAVMIPRAPPAADAHAGPGATSGHSLGKLIAAYGLFGFGYVITATFIVAIVRATPEARGVEPLVWLVVGVTAAPSVWLWTRVGGRIGLLEAFAAACVVEATGVALSVLWPTAAGALLASALLGGTYMGVTALGLVAAREASASPRRAVALMTAAFGLGQMVGPTVAGYAAEHLGGFTAPSLAAAVALCLSAALTMAARRRS